MVSKRHKIINVPLFKKIWDIIWDNLRGQKSIGPRKMLKWQKSDCPSKKKIMSHSFLNSGTLIVILSTPKISLKN